MGMYDTVKYECTCDNCRAKVTGFQSKDGDNILDIISPLSVSEFYSSCSKCGCWISFKRKDGNVYTKTTTSQRFGMSLSLYKKDVKVKEVK